MENSYFGIGSRIVHQEFGNGVVVQVKTDTYQISFFEHGIKEISRKYEGFEVVEAIEADENRVTMEDIEKSLIKILRKFSDIQEVVPMADKWRGGRVTFQPGNTELKPYEMPVDTFFHKIVMVRDRLRVMEQHINSSKLDDEEKVNLQQYITKIYGSLTSFNILFKNRSEDFTGMR
jgi:hypothetical protein